MGVGFVSALSLGKRLRHLSLFTFYFSFVHVSFSGGQDNDVTESKVFNLLRKIGKIITILSDETDMP